MQHLLDLPAPDAPTWHAALTALITHSVRALAQQGVLPLHAARAVGLLTKAATSTQQLLPSGSCCGSFQAQLCACIQEVLVVCPGSARHAVALLRLLPSAAGGAAPTDTTTAGLTAAASATPAAAAAAAAGGEQGEGPSAAQAALRAAVLPCVRAVGAWLNEPAVASEWIFHTGPVVRSTGLVRCWLVSLSKGGTACDGRLVVR